MGCLSQFMLDGTTTKEFPLSVEFLSGLVLLNLKDCKNLESLPSDIINGLKCLTTLNLSGCSKLENVPENLREVERLEELDISGAAVRQLASSIFLPKNLKALPVRGCKRPSRINIIVFALPHHFDTKEKFKSHGSGVAIFVSIRGIRVDGCASLERVSGALKSCKSKWLSVSAVKCFKLVDNNDWVSSVLKGFLEAVPDHLWVFYLSNPSSCEAGWNFESNHVELSFGLNPFLDTGLEVKKCGVHPVYVDDIEEFNNKNEERSRSKAWNLNESDYIFDVATARVSTKRSLIECVLEQKPDDEQRNLNDIKNLNE
ncbi:TMV resistance protein like [Melia azedarach]|uniref:TMV resistance protein like n=1 Tax=Melia azedarach TaxID=155640 RepID=A0ACC1X467_MELAZ|nr:TMV resistance protein like [Melia azedarach]